MAYNPSSPRLALRNSELQIGENVTVRLGPKWVDKYSMNKYKAFDAVVIDKDGAPIKSVIVKRVMFLPLKLVPAGALKKQPVGSPQTIEGLIADLAANYKRAVTREDDVSVLFFE